MDVGLGGRYDGLWTQTAGTNYPSLVSPQGTSQRALFFSIEYAGRKHFFMVDADSQEAPFSDRVVYDANHNMDLRDDPLLKTHVVCRANMYYLR